MPQHLTDITISEVSLVDAPANKGARVMLFKRDDGLPAGFHYVPAGFDYRSSITKKEFSDDKRKELAGTGAALPDGSFPIENKGDLANAIKAYGRASDKAKAKAHIMARAKTLGASDMIPEDWAKRAIAKDAGDAALFDETVTDGDAAEYAQDICEAIDCANRALHESICSILSDDEVDDKQAMLEQTFDQYKTHIQTIVPEEMEKALATARAAVSKAKENNSMTQDEIKKLLADEVKKAVDPLQATIEKLTAENAVLKLSDKHKAYMDKTDMSDDAKKKFMSKTNEERDAHMADHPVEKALPEYVQKALKEADELKKRLASLEDDKALSVLSKRATDAGLPAEFGAILQKAERGDKEALGKIVDKYAELNKSKAAIEKTSRIFDEFGTSRGASGSAMEQLNVKAEELRKSDGKLSQAQAFAKVYADPANKELVTLEKQQQRAKAATAPVAA